MKPLPALVVPVLAAVIACSPSSSVAWDDPVPLPPELTRASRLTFDAGGRLVPLEEPVVARPSAPGQCVESVRIARDTSSGWYAAWWSLRPDSTATLVVAWSGNGRTWDVPVVVDTLDVARVGCARPAPSIAADSGNVHVAYAMAAREAPGIFASHSMDRGTMFHSPVAVVYGERIGATAIAARGFLVAVAYEDPNATQDRIGIAVSRTMAHLFQWRETVSGAGARRPDVAVGRGRIAVTWASGGGSAGATTRLLRTGDLR